MSDTPIDPLSGRLQALAPAVDMAASRRLFETERRITPRRPPRWLLSAAAFALLVAGVVGIWALTRSDDGLLPAQPPDESAAEPPSDSVPQPIEPAAPFEVIAVQETTVELGTIRVAQSVTGLEGWWRGDLPDDDVPSVDFGPSFVVAFTVPDDACPERFAGFNVDGSTTPPVWGPEFERTVTECDAPDINRTHVIAVPRPAARTTITFRLPGNEARDVSDSEVTVDIDPPSTNTDSDDTELVALGASVPLPPVGEPRLEAGTFGLVWIVRHQDESVSVLDAIVDRPTGSDGGNTVSGLGDLVRPTADGLGFVGGRYLWDERGRVVDGPRSADLVGYEGVVVGDQVELYRSGRTRFDGEPDVVPARTPADLDLDGTLPLIELDVLPTLSSLGPVWRHLDATLVVKNGSGALCEIDPTVPVLELATCGDGAVVTTASSDQREVTSWFFGPVLAEFDDLGRVVTVVPLGEQASRNRSASPDELPFGGTWYQLESPSVIRDDPTPLVIVDEAELRDLGVDPLATVVLDLSVVGPDCGVLLTTVTVRDQLIRPVFSPADTECGSSARSETSWRFRIVIDRTALDGRFFVEAPVRLGEPPMSTRFELSTGEVVADGSSADGEIAGEGWRLIPGWSGDDADDGTDQPLPQIAVDSDGLDRLGVRPDAIDLETSIVVGVSVFGNSCRPVLRSVLIDGDRVVPSFTPEAADFCNDIGVRYPFAIELQRAALTDRVSLTPPRPGGSVTTTFDAATGALLEGGLTLDESSFLDCPVEPGGPYLLGLILLSAADRVVDVGFRSDDGATATSGQFDVTAGRADFIRLPIEAVPPSGLRGVITITATDPPATTDGFVNLDEVSIADSVAYCEE